MWKGGYSPKNQNHCLHLFLFFFFFPMSLLKKVCYEGGGFHPKKTRWGTFIKQNRPTIRHQSIAKLDDWQFFGTCKPRQPTESARDRQMYNFFFLYGKPLKVFLSVILFDRFSVCAAEIYQMKQVIAKWFSAGSIGGDLKTLELQSDSGFWGGPIWRNCTGK